MKFLQTALAAALVLLAPPVIAQNAPPTTVRATVESVAADGASASVRTRAGEERTVRLSPKTRFTFVVPAALADVKPGAFIGVAATPGEDGELKAMEVHIFPEAMRGTGEGHRPFDLAPGSSMTNGAVAARVEGVAGPKLTSPTRAASRPSSSIRKRRSWPLSPRPKAISNRERRSWREARSRTTARSRRPSC